MDTPLLVSAQEEPAAETGIAGIMAAKPNEQPMQMLRKWIIALELAISRGDGAAIRAILKHAVPEYGSAGAYWKYAESR